MPNTFQRHVGDGGLRDESQKTRAELIPHPTAEQFREGWARRMVGLPAQPDLRSQGWYAAQAHIDEGNRPTRNEIINSQRILLTEFGYVVQDFPPL